MVRSVASEIARRLESLGASFGATAGSKGAYFSLTAPVANMEEAGKVLATILTSADYPQAAFERERKRAATSAGEIPSSAVTIHCRQVVHHTRSPAPARLVPHKNLGTERGGPFDLRWPLELCPSFARVVAHMLAILWIENAVVVLFARCVGRRMHVLSEPTEPHAIPFPIHRYPRTNRRQRALCLPFRLRGL